MVRGIRIVSDPRDPSGDRDEAYLLRNFLNARFGRKGWQCEDLPPEPGETPVTGIFIKQRCEKDLGDGVHGLLMTRHLGKPGPSQSTRTRARRRPTSSRAMCGSGWSR